MAEQDFERQILDLTRRLAAIEDQLRTFTSSPQDDTLGSQQKAFKEQFLTGNGHVSKITLGADGESLTVEKVR